MRNEENTGHILRDKHVITGLSLREKYLLSANLSFIKRSKEKQE